MGRRVACEWRKEERQERKDVTDDGRKQKIKEGRHVGSREESRHTEGGRRREEIQEREDVTVDKRKQKIKKGRHVGSRKRR